MTHTPAYYGTAFITAVKSTIVEGPGMEVGLSLPDDPFTDGNSRPRTNNIKLFAVVIYEFS